MSLTGLLATRSSLGTVRRAAEVTTASGGTKRTWTDTATGVAAWVNELSRGRAQRLWGQETEATHEAVFEAAVDVRPGDGFVVTGGPYTGERFRVHIVASPLTGPSHRHAALHRSVSSTEFA